MSNLDAVKSLRAAANAMRELPRKMGEFFANGGPGVSNPVVGDRYMGAGNGRFAPLNTDYALHKATMSKGLNAHQRDTYGRGSKLIPVEHKARRQGIDIHGTAKSSLPILVLTGKLRATVAFNRHHTVDVQGDVAMVTFVDLPSYAKYLHTGTKRMPKRSPVEPNAADMARVTEYAERWLSAQIGSGSYATAFGGGKARII